MKLAELNELPEKDAVKELQRCCGSKEWASQMAESRPFRDEEDLFEAADEIWSDLSEEDWVEAFKHHPKIGEAPDKKHASTAAWAKEEQAGASKASPAVLKELADLNAEYVKKFGYVFLVCATGKTADEMLALLKTRLTNHPEEELDEAADEQKKITRLRLEKLLKS